MKEIVDFEEELATDSLGMSELFTIEEVERLLRPLALEATGEYNRVRARIPEFVARVNQLTPPKIARVRRTLADFDLKLPPGEKIEFNRSSFESVSRLLDHAIDTSSRED